MRIPALVLRDGKRMQLESWVRSSSVRAGMAQRARIVLLAADGVSRTEIADRVGVSHPTVTGWRARYDGDGTFFVFVEESQAGMKDAIIPAQRGGGAG